MTPESKPQGSLLPIGTRIRFTKTLASLASGDHPAFLFAEEGDEGEITGHGTKEGYWAKTSYNPPFGVSRDEFEPIEASKPQGSEQHMRQIASFEGNWPEDFPGENGNYLNFCLDCQRHFLGHKRRVTCKLCALPNPSADEEVERRSVEDIAIAYGRAMGRPEMEDAIIDALKEQRQQHNAEREEFIESAVARDKKADEDRDAYESLINELKAQLEAARTQCALRSAGHDDLRTRLNKANAQKTALYFENSDALAEPQQLRTSLAEKEMALNEQMVMRSQDVKTRDELIESMADTANQWQDRYAKLQSELATAQAEKHGLEDVVLATRNMSIEAFDRIRALIGASPNDPRPCETLVSELIESLRSQLQTAMEERDAARRQLQVVDHALFDGRELNYTPDRLLAIQTRDKLAKETVEKLATANSRLEEAEKALRKCVVQLGHCKAGYHLGRKIDEAYDEATALLSRLSASRSTENKTNEA